MTSTSGTELVLRTSSEVLAVITKLELMLVESDTVEKAMQTWKISKASIAASDALFSQARRQNEDVAAQIGQLKMIQTQAAVKIGQFLDAMPKNKGNLLRGDTQEPRDETPTLKELGIGKKQSSRFQQLANLPEIYLSRIACGALSVSGAVEEHRRDEAARLAPKAPPKVLVEARTSKKKSVDSDARRRGELGFLTMQLLDLLTQALEESPKNIYGFDRNRLVKLRDLLDQLLGPHEVLVDDHEDAGGGGHTYDHQDQPEPLAAAGLEPPT